MGNKMTRNSLPSESLQASMHRLIRHFLNKKHQGLVMQAFRDTVPEPNPQAVKFAQAIQGNWQDGEWGCCLHCGHGNHSTENHSPDCVYLDACKFLGLECWVPPEPPKYVTRKVCALYLKPLMHLVVDDCLCEIRSISASSQPHPAHFDVEVMLETGITEHFHFTMLQDVYITEGATALQYV